MIVLNKMRELKFGICQRDIKHPKDNHWGFKTARSSRIKGQTSAALKQTCKCTSVVKMNVILNSKIYK